MSFEERWYQKEAADAAGEFLLSEEKQGHPIVVLPTGSGKTIVLCGIIDRFLSERPSEDILVLSHVQEILEQDFEALEHHFAEGFIGLWSSGLNSKTKKKITVAGIQSVFRNPKRFSNVGLVLIDECHLISHKDQGMYRKFLGALDAFYCGLTATPWRLGHGMINEGDGTLFTDIVYDASSFEKFNQLVEEGFLSPIITKKTLLDMSSVEGVRTTGGDFNGKDLSTKFDRETITDAAVHEVIKYGRNYKKWMMFAIDIDHADHIAEKMNEYGIPTTVIHSRMEEERKEEIRKIKEGEVRCAVSVNALTTGFDVKDIDLIAILRPTKSPVVHVQTIGRGLRVAEGKEHCLVLDFAGNTKRLGPINDIQIAQRGKKKIGSGGAITKDCKECGTVHHPSVKICPVCGTEFEFQEKLSATADTTEIIKKEEKKPEPRWMKVLKIEYSVHNKRGKPSSLKVTYWGQLGKVDQYVCYDHVGYARHLAKHWVKMRMEEPMPKDVAELYARKAELKVPNRILVELDGKRLNAKEYEWLEK